ncbi:MULTISPECIES: PD-(D/E)XK nuclease family protein [Mesotoga]|uniref:PD-(D/E)XK nuclease family protein n=2 Tax=Kosmotogaceae TaxID=1643948 RepID=UPI0002CAA998|nr:MULTISPECIES: PD-(D/E)XK nuclease family protein [Mesotoga]MCP5460271.1 PD-(D/E)XK nuclease family protein [Thermotogota bacterium]CCU83940.1 ATP-dependent nuclease subunit B-like protein [Mesotoga infera]RLL81806.1 ATP-dependent nuclease subunit B [Mesotoga sp. H07pep.5.4]HNQ69736.1 PD-(D/E)XK nuclease family protein [Mesotoga prima]HNS75510.1 PD-(D/E)XK nuclease family protein [Mesotoga prima]
MKITLFIGPLASAKTERLLRELETVHWRDPFSYFFVGPSGDHVRYFRENFISRVGTIPASRFLAMDQFAVEVFRRLNPNSIHVGNHLMRLEIGDILDQMGKGELADSPVFVEYLLEMIHDVKENRGFDRIFSTEDEAVSVLESIYNELDSRFSRRNIFDTFDAYTRIEEHKDELINEEFGDTLFLDGFHDFSPALKIFFKTIIPTYREVFITITQEPDKESLFSNIDSILETIDEIAENSTDLEIKRIFFEKSSSSSGLNGFKEALFSPGKVEQNCDSVSVVVYPDIFAEVEGVSRFVKESIISACEPGDISIVSSDFNLYSKLLSDKLNEYGVPHRIEGDEELHSSLSIRRLILPLETAVLGFPPEKIIAMADSGYGGEVDSSFIESAAAMSRIIYERPNMWLSLEKRRSSWDERLSRLVDLMKERRNAIISLADDELEMSAAEELDETIERIDSEVVPAVQRIFRLLDSFRSLRKRDVGNYRKMFITWEKELSLIQSLTGYESEVKDREMDAIVRFFEHTLPYLERLLYFMGKSSVSPREYYRYLMLLLKHDKFPLSRNKANRVEIQSLINSRFSKKRMKIFVGFVDGAYPHVEMNPLYSFTQFGDSRPRDLLLDEETHERLNLYLSISTAEESVRFSLPESTIDGEPILPSPYLKNVAESSGCETTREGRKVGRRSGYIPELRASMSQSELKISAVKFFLNEKWDLLKSFPPLSNLDTVLSNFRRDFSWSVQNRRRLEEVVGNVFSFSRLKSYHDCPFSFFLSYVVGLDVSPEYVFELTPLDEGNIFHSVLKDFFSGKNRDWQDSLAENIKRHLMHDSNIVFRFEFERLSEVLHEYITVREGKRPNFMGDNFIPYAFEKAFGIGETEPVKLLENLYLRGKIDRVDIDRSSSSVYLIDYKRGDSGDERQLLLYSLVAEKLLEDESLDVAGGVFKTLTGKTVNKAAFRTISSEGGKVWEFAGKKKDNRIVKESDLLKWLKEVHEGIYSGEFTPSFTVSASKCYSCRFSEIKRSITWREGRKEYE